MSDTMPLVLTLDDPAATVAAAGGKGAALARLARAGLPVPPGFDVTTRAYRDFTAGLGDQLAQAASPVGPPGRPAALLDGRPVPEAAAAAIAAAYARLGDDVPVAVRSSATTEDQPGGSAAGQHDTFLNVRGEAAVLDAVRRCWASLWTARAIAYRTRHDTARDEGRPAMAVVVQRLVPADAAGVLFTADPLTGRRDQVVINAAWGLGEAVVSGQVTPDVAVTDRSGRLARYDTGAKAAMTVPADGGTRTEPVPDGRRGQRVLSAADAAELTRHGLVIEALLGQPADVEWARAGGRLFILQARPLTAAGEDWNDTSRGDFLWSAGNLGEALPDVMTPATWSFVQLFMTRTATPVSVPGYPGYGQIAGHFYANVSVAASVAAAVGMPAGRFAAMSEPVFGHLPPLAGIPRLPLSRTRVIRLFLPVAAGMRRQVSQGRGQLAGFVAGAARRCDDLRAAVRDAPDPAALAALWPTGVEPFFLAASGMLTVVGLTVGPLLLAGPRRLARLVGPADADLLLSARPAGGAGLASLGPVLGLAQLSRGEIDRDTFSRRYGHRGPHELEVSAPRPAEDPDWIDRELAALAGASHAASELLAGRAAARAAAWARLARQRPRQATRARRLAARWGRAAQQREAVRSELVRAFWLLRDWVLRAGQLTGYGDDLFYLGWPEILDVLNGAPAALDRVPARRAAYTAAAALPPLPPLIRGRFDPVRWAADTGRRTDRFDDHDAPYSARPPAAGRVTGLAGAPGVAEGTARLVARPEDAAQLGDGEILVTTVTNIGWTPVFPRAAAVVTDVGAPLSHAAIVARELGIPAVVGCGDATAVLRSGDRVRVDGGAGTVDVLRPA
jgi:rifampicin phosphotransferase